MSVRTEKVASLIREEIGLLFTRDFNEPSLGFLTVTEVRMTADLKIAKVYVSIFGDAKLREQTMERLDSRKSEIRHYLGARVHLKYTPEIHFYVDETMDRVQRINELIRDTRRDNH